MAAVEARVHKDGTVEDVISHPEPYSDRPGSPLSMDDSLRTQLANDPELQGLSLYEKKALLINRELDSHGMGRYQWWIWTLCGFGYFLDLMWAQAFGLALVAIVPEFGLVGDKSALSGNLSTAFSAGLTAGAFVWGFLVDIIGRWWAFNGTCFVASVFGLALGASKDYTTLLVLTAFCGFGVGGNIPIDTTICLEFLPQNRRFLLVVLSLFQPLGVVVSCGIAYGLIPTHTCAHPVQCGTQLPGEPCCDRASNAGWRYFLYCLGAITLFIFLVRFLAFRFRESPKYLLYRGHDVKAAKVLEQIATFNKREPMITLAHFEALADDDDALVTALDTKNKGKRSGRRGALGDGQARASFGLLHAIRGEALRISELFKTWGIAYMTLLTWVTYMFDYLSFSAAGTYIPLILKAKGAQLGVSTSETYRNYIIVYAPGIIGALLGGAIYMIPSYGRKWGMAIASALQGVSLFLFAAARTETAFIGFNVLEYFMQTLFNAILYGWTPEIFPAPIRGTACGLASFFGRVFGIISPLISSHIYASYAGRESEPDFGNGVLYFAGGSVFISTICVLLMPNKRMGAQSF